MRYAKIDECETVNGIGCGISVYIQGCPAPHCKGCFNPETWDFNGGKEWLQETEEEFMKLIDRPYIKRVSILGGEPLAIPYPTYCLTNKIRQQFRKEKSIWIYSGYTWEEIMMSREKTKAILSADVLVDGRFEEDKKDLSLKFRGSSNQRIIDVQKSMQEGRIILYGDLND